MLFVLIKNKNKKQMIVTIIENLLTRKKTNDGM